MRLDFRVIAAAFLMLLVPAIPASAFDVFLDYNTDENPNTFTNYVVGPETVPIDIVVSFTEADLDLDMLQFFVRWEYVPQDLECFDMVGQVLYQPYEYLPDQTVFTNIFAFTCVCRTRCHCSSEMILTADISGLTEPGNYAIARLDFTRWGLSKENCNSRLWAKAVFETLCTFPSCENPDDPRAKMTLQDTATSTQDPALSSWGKVKALYR